ncbi:MAG: hypothetical protein LBT86_02305 [Deltaproteobacteria bacterium]|nr:hypothetical protein [Deltaproteobacteria bacterium]
MRVYGSSQIDNGLFFDANLASAHSKNHAKNIDDNGGWKKGDFIWTLGGLGLNEIFDLGALKLTTPVGLSYIKARQDGWIESVYETILALIKVFSKKSTHFMDTSLVSRLNGSSMAGSAKIDGHAKNPKFKNPNGYVLETNTFLFDNFP